MKKLYSMLLAAVLSLCMVLSAGGVKADSASSEYQAGDIVTFGSYPQTQVTDTTLISTLDNQSKTWKSYKYYSKNTGDDSAQYPTMLNESMMKYADFTYNGVKYRAVKILKYRPESATQAEETSTQQSEKFSKNKVYYFIWEPIEWIVLDPSSGMLLAKNILDGQSFNAYWYVNNYKDCHISYNKNADANDFVYSTMYDWLNAVGQKLNTHFAWSTEFNFLNSAFSTEDQSAIIQYSIANLQNSENVKTKVFLLSKDEYTAYSSVIGNSGMQVTSYASIQGVTGSGTGSAGWYLRTARTTSGTVGKTVWYVMGTNTGYSNTVMADIGSSKCGTRPAVRVDLSSDQVQPLEELTISAASRMIAASGVVRMTWDEFEGATSYKVYRCDSTVDPTVESNWSTTPLGTVVASDDQDIYVFTDSTAMSEHSYYYRVKAFTGSRTICSNTLLIDCRLRNPSATGTNNLSGAPVIKWNSVSGADYYHVFRRVAGTTGEFTRVSSKTSGNLSFTDTGAELETSYEYWVQAVSSAGSKYDSYHPAFNYAITVPVKLPSTSIVGNGVQNGHTQITWSAVTGASKYLVEVKESSSDTWSTLVNTTSTSTTHTNGVGGRQYDYRVTVVSAVGSDYNSVPSAVMTITAPDSGVEITANPGNASVIVGETATFRVEASGTGLSYQWQYKSPGSSTWSNSTQSGAKTAKLSVTTNVNHNGYQYHCVVTSATGASKTSNSANLTVKPKITSHPADKTVAVGDTAVFSVTAYGKEKLTYQWECKSPTATAWSNSTQTGAQTETLSVATNVNHNGYQYRCVVKDANGKKTYSNPAILTIKPKITTQPSNKTVAVGNTAVFKVAANGKATLKYQWQCKAPSATTWSDSTQSGAKTATLSVSTNVNHNGYQYRCMVTDGNGKKSYSNPATLTIIPKITTQPSSKTVTAGTTVSLTVAATGKATLKYQWQYKSPGSSTWKNSTQTGATTTTLQIKTTTNHNGYQYRCVVTDGNEKEAESNAATLTVK